MEKSGTERVYPAAPLETVIVKNEQHQTLLPPSPPSYDQATSTPAFTATPAATATAATTSIDTTPIVVVTQPAALPYGPHPVDVQCPFCHNFTRTRIRHKPNSKTHLIALLLCLLQLYCCVCLPYCIGSCMSTNHYCGICDRYLGTFRRSA
ncbi:lipopolysaccharide-induced tumor necrosis factor-alpha factor-like [Teleopsis dalmanni]|uniref:lipopolysaccharide-induced tumor necrosis factor-alpha factor-like n=1 Tax=Teleopsis dalmanni TaxID=139649 RepID=UPI0018CEA9D4|nr:lipopolysaccharide-induced tumor necrosis factor-alpha factor-like [Teleopsis dalmanni]